MMAENIIKSLKNEIHNFESFSIALDDSTDVYDTAQLVIFIRGVDSFFNITEELLIIRALRGTTTGEDMFKIVSAAFEYFGIKWNLLSGICTDGAPSMIGKQKGFIGIVNKNSKDLKINLENLTNFHCIIHQQNLCGKSIKFKSVMDDVVSIVNFIKSRALNHRQFKKYLSDIFSEHEDISYYCEIRWLSRGKMLKRFYDLRQEISDFMEMKERSTYKIQDPEWICDLAFLVDVTSYLNELNLKLQRHDQLIHELYGHVKAFCNKLCLLEIQIRAKNCHHFPTLSKHENIPYNYYGDELHKLAENFAVRFVDFKNKETKFTIFAHPLGADVYNAPQNLQLELIDLQADFELKSKFNNVSLLDFYKLYLQEEKYPNLRSFARKIISLFGSTYICEQFFSKMKYNKSKTRSRITDDNLEKSMRVSLSKLNINIDDLVVQVQKQSSN
ncbi:General transcription factor II-I repeat domain-containing protein 2A [Dictyocoela muelleri]|nr:General transcription factor II-I repeat domain-containing protein 2A [Dictyocoela muelleri]